MKDSLINLLKWIQYVIKKYLQCLFNLFHNKTRENIMPFVNGCTTNTVLGYIHIVRLRPNNINKLRLSSNNKIYINIYKYSST